MSDVEGIIKAVGKGFRKHITEYDTEIIPIPFKQQYPNERVTHRTDELTSVCPVSGLPDFYNLTISYIPDKLLIELKSLKMYLMSFRDVGVLHEDLAPLILNELVEKVDPKEMTLTMRVALRGGIGTDVVVEYRREEQLPT